MRTYSELMKYTSLEDRFEYLKLGGVIGESTFGSERWINQRFYRSAEWRDIRSYIITRDLGFDLGVTDEPIRGAISIHHINPLTVHDVEEATENLLNPEFLISTSHRTHNAIHFGDANLLPAKFVEREPGDTRLW